MRSECCQIRETSLDISMFLGRRRQAMLVYGDEAGGTVGDVGRRTGGEFSFVAVWPHGRHSRARWKIVLL